MQSKGNLVSFWTICLVAILCGLVALQASCLERDYVCSHGLNLVDKRRCLDCCRAHGYNSVYNPKEIDQLNLPLFNMLKGISCVCENIEVTHNIVDSTSSIE